MPSATVPRSSPIVSVPKVSLSNVSLFDVPSRQSSGPLRALSERDAIDIWIARWLGIRPKHLIARYGCDPRRLYEIWEGLKHPAARAKALEEFSAQYPGLLDRVDFGAHRRIPRNEKAPEQLGLFEERGSA